MNAFLLLAAWLSAAPLPDSVRLIDVTGGLKADWVLPDGTGLGCRFTVDPQGQPWYACRGRFLVGPAYADTRQLDKFYMVSWSTNALYGSRGDAFGVYQGRSLRVLKRFPGKTVTLREGAAGSLYLTAYGNANGGATDVYVIAGGKATKLLTTNEVVSALTGDGRRHFIALNRTAYHLAPDGKIEKLHEFPKTTQQVALRYDPALGLFYATDTGVGYLGAALEHEFLLTAKPEIRMAGGTLYVKPANGGVLKLTGLEDFAALDSALAEAD